MATGFILQANPASIHQVLLEPQETTNSRGAKRSRVAFTLDALLRVKMGGGVGNGGWSVFYSWVP